MLKGGIKCNPCGKSGKSLNFEVGQKWSFGQLQCEEPLHPDSCENVLLTIKETLELDESLCKQTHMVVWEALVHLMLLTSEHNMVVLLRVVPEFILATTTMYRINITVWMTIQNKMKEVSIMQHCFTLTVLGFGRAKTMNHSRCTLSSHIDPITYTFVSVQCSKQRITTLHPSDHCLI